MGDHLSYLSVLIWKFSVSSLFSLSSSFIFLIYLCFCHLMPFSVHILLLSHSLSSCASLPPLCSSGRHFLVLNPSFFSSSFNYSLYFMSVFIILLLPTPPSPSSFAYLAAGSWDGAIMCSTGDGTGWGWCSRAWWKNTLPHRCGGENAWMYTLGDFID